MKETTHTTHWECLESESNALRFRRKTPEDWTKVAYVELSECVECGRWIVVELLADNDIGEIYDYGTGMSKDDILADYGL